MPVQKIPLMLVIAGLAACAGEPPAPHAEVEGFNNFTAKLEIELTRPAQFFGNTGNLQALPDARVKSLELEARYFDTATDEFRPLTPAEQQSVAFRGAQIKLRGDAGVPVEHAAPNGQYFTVQELFEAVEATERQTRDKTEWLGGVDVHHIHFEGIELQPDGVWEIHWGS